MAERFDRGDLLQIDANFTDTDGAATDPDTVTFSTLTDGAVTDYVYETDDEVSRVALGHYRALISLDTVGIWWVRVEATGAGQAAAEHRIRVASSFPTG